LISSQAIPSTDTSTDAHRYIHACPWGRDFRGKSKGGGKGKERGKSRGGEKRLYAKDASCYNSIRLCLRSVQTTCVSNQRARDVMRRGALSYSDISGHVCGLNPPSLPPSLPPSRLFEIETHGETGCSVLAGCSPGTLNNSFFYRVTVKGGMDTGVARA